MEPQYNYEFEEEKEEEEEEQEQEEDKKEEVCILLTVWDYFFIKYFLQVSNDEDNKLVSCENDLSDYLHRRGEVRCNLLIKNTLC